MRILIDTNVILDIVIIHKSNENINILSCDIKYSIMIGVLKSLKIERWVAGAGYRVKNRAFKWGI